MSPIERARKSAPVTAIVMVLFAGLFPAGADCAENAAIRPIEKWATAFGGSEFVQHFSVTTNRQLSTRATWTLSIKERILARGAAAFEARPDAPGQVEIRLKLPEAKPGIVLELSLAVSLGEDNEGSRAVKQLWIFPKDPFLDQRQWLENLKISLFDPEKKTARVLTEMKIPFTETRDVSSVREGTLIIGEGVSFREFRRLPKNMADAASRGVAVLCLAPAAGEMMIPGLEPGGTLQPQRLTLGRLDIIKEFDARLDATSWPPDGKIISGSILPTGRRSGISGEVSPDARGWPWMIATFGEGDGRLVLCGFAIIEKWESGPTPRFFFKQVLKQLDQR